MSMTCDGALERILAADPDELRPDAPGELAAHLRGCAACAARARRILEAEAGLAGVMARLSAPGHVEPLSDDVSSATPTATRRPSRASARFRRSLRVAAPLAAAAAVAVIWGTAHEEAPAPTPRPDLDQVYALEQPLVSAPDGRRTAVMATRKPGITVVWFF